MDFYTLKTSVDIVADKDAFAAVLSTVGFFTQPLIVGDPVEDGVFVIRFSVRAETMRAFESDLIENLSKTKFGFTKANTEIVRAARL